ncbi:nucleoside deaminase [Actinokineospora pegani]|uniref:nucleoside deaminase n=1 Tax=Actinokineospora pegani TaxID=2654637 RepID=UPI0012E9CF53|nr:nucleoside deaminase [Actinokineospora pegani]
MTEQPSPEQRWLAEAVRLAERNVAEGGGPFGALVVKGAEVLATGVNRVTPDRDPTAHAEVVAIRAACQVLDDFTLTGCVLVASCEPCPLCLSAALWARLDTVLYAADRHDAEAAGFDDRVFYDVFSLPRAEWPLTVAQHRTGAEAAPFQAWTAKPDRTGY